MGRAMVARLGLGLLLLALLLPTQVSSRGWGLRPRGWGCPQGLAHRPTWGRRLRLREGI